ncbi:uncharacterized protein C20orf96 homolog isoform X2 [Oncorhynchus mykiss]|uniref:uncharacterized protein C20orf96 homolog isoform X2 n=1 Tax=Oncorhynchus mykiss TaxID=8022 RepID=UPI000B4E912E|nr:uncharacterized protein C20orf96 homolog isoform X2 [Oncorhynchus mykiss]
MNVLPNHLVKSLKEDFKKLDYSKWERCNRSKTEPPPWVILPPLHNKTTGSPSERSPATGREESGTSSATHNFFPTTDKPGKSHPNTGHEESTASSMGRLSRRRRNERVKLDPITLKKQENIKTLNLLIMSRKKALVELEKHCALLQESNVRMAGEIDSTDRQSVSSAREFLIRHDKLGSSIAAFNSWSHSQMEQAKTEVQEAETAAKNKLSGLHEQLRGVKAELVNAQAELHTLKTYKDKEYPVKALRIAEIKREIEKLKETQQDENEDVNLLCQTEIVYLERRSQHEEQEVLSVIAKQNVSYIPCVVKLMAAHNQTIKKEIGIHKKEIAELEDKNRELIKSVQELQISRTNIRKDIFQDVFPKSDKYVKMHPGYGGDLKHPS